MIGRGQYDQGEGCAEHEESTKTIAKVAKRAA
jgi:hypothetical protein